MPLSDGSFHDDVVCIYTGIEYAEGELFSQVSEYVQQQLLNVYVSGLSNKM